MVPSLEVWMGRSPSPGSVVGDALTRMSYSLEPILAVPPGWTTFPAASAFRTSAGERPWACRALGLRLTRMVRCLPPYTLGTTAPWMVTSWVRMTLVPISLRRCSESPWPESPSWMMGTEEAEKLMICGESVPGGSCLRMYDEAAATCALASTTEAPGCR